jgi:hypothetical protein
MGQYRMEITAVGGHGCKREPIEGERVYGCRRMDCPDCAFADFVERLRRHGAGPMIESATFTHWPGTPNEVVDRVTIAEWGGAEVTRERGRFVHVIEVDGCERRIGGRLTRREILALVGRADVLCDLYLSRGGNGPDLLIGLDAVVDIESGQRFYTTQAGLSR